MFSQLEERFISHLGAACVQDLKSSLLKRPSDFTVIAFGGDQLTGKSTLAKNLAKHFGGHFISSGKFPMIQN
jgi:tRNA A37 threonylcarbamoyladenosine biosynthesis protein TsaE